MKKYKIIFNDDTSMTIEANGFKEDEAFINFYIRNNPTDKKEYTYVISACNMKYIEVCK